MRGFKVTLCTKANPEDPQSFECCSNALADLFEVWAKQLRDGGSLLDSNDNELLSIEIEELVREKDEEKKDPEEVDEK